MSRFLAFSVVLLLNLTHIHPVFAKGDYELVISHLDKTLVVKKQDVVIRTFHVALGSGGHYGKREAGDRKTPHGQYHIVRVRDSDRFHLFMQLDYPSVADAMRALKKDIIDKRQYNAILDAHIYHKLPPQNTKLGGQIGIHGIGLETKDKIEIHQLADWTQGCIALRNYEIEQLMQYVSVGTKVTITD